jgi:hypothetical protein
VLGTVSGVFDPPPGTVLFHHWKIVMAFYAALYLLSVHSFYDNACCNDVHCHPVPCDQITSTSNGWMWNGMTFSRSMMHQAPDGNCHVCVAAGPICIYLPSRA